MNATALPHSLRRLGATLAAMLAEGHLAQVVRGAGLVMGIRIAGAAIALLSQVLLARWMGAFEYGIFAYVWVWVIILGIIAPMGFGTSTLRFVPDYRINAKWRRLAGILHDSWWIVLVLGLAFMVLGLAAIGILRNEIEGYYVLPLVLAMMCVPGFALTDTLEGTARAFGWVSLAYLPAYIIRPLGIVAVGALIHFMFGGLTGVAAVAGALAATLLTLAGQRFFLNRRIGAAIPRAKPIRHTRYWVAASLPLVLAEGLYLLLLNTDIVLLGYFVDPNEVGIYFAATRITNLVVFIYFAVAALAVPKFSELHAAGDRVGLQVFVHNIIQWIFWPTLAAAGFLLLIGEFALNLFGEGFDKGYPLLAVLMLGFVARASTGPVEYLLNMTGHQNLTAAVYGAAALLNIALNLVFVPRFGLMGAAAGTAASLVFASFCLFLIARRRLGITSFVLSRSGFASPATV
ncbi:MAG TPA: oligosaccharide flippase family protein [Parvibaculum sp.]|uniref:oligosaccharide flippase family protein n=1 Tax=Parvibaculum sp. TaxID=2024848 RepID=UPI002B9BD5E2|nr:oligosaccharide flippase family protein [Parvibaculum sp.]HMM13532.1 oligosaccharide flippase family protein [Parvibaculum sp.]